MYETTVELVNGEEVDVEVPEPTHETHRKIVSITTPGLQGQRPPTIADLGNLVTVLTTLTSLDKQQAANITLSEISNLLDEITPYLSGSEPDEPDDSGLLGDLPVDEYGQVDLDDMR